MNELIKQIKQLTQQQIALTQKSVLSIISSKIYNLTKEINNTNNRLLLNELNKWKQLKEMNEYQLFLQLNQFLQYCNITLKERKMIQNNSIEMNKTIKMKMRKNLQEYFPEMIYYIRPVGDLYYLNKFHELFSILL